MLTLPTPLTRPGVAEGGHVAAKVMLDLTVYLAGPQEHELDYLVELYERVCPQDRLVKYTITELDVYARLDEVVLTASGRAAAAAGVAQPYFQPVRHRTREGRGFDAGYWDGREIDDPHGSWFFTCRRILRRSSGLHAFVRIGVPLATDPSVLTGIASAIAQNVEFYSGHGGLSFTYDPWYLNSAFDFIYARSRRFWGIDIEYMNRTLPLMRAAIKGVNWLTLLGRCLPVDAEAAERVARLRGVEGVALDRCAQGVVVIAGDVPTAGDQHRPDRGLERYTSVANAFAPLFVESHPDFPGERFAVNGNTMGWIQRFVEPAGWR